MNFRILEILRKKPGISVKKTWKTWKKPGIKTQNFAGHPVLVTSGLFTFSISSLLWRISNILCILKGAWQNKRGVAK